MDDPLILSERIGRVGVLTLNRPRQLNALSDALMDALGEGLLELDADAGIGAIVIKGGAKAFAAGADIAAMSDWTYTDVYQSEFITRNWETIRRVRKPVIAAVCGYAMGGGCELALACDIVIAAQSARFALPEVKLAMLPGAGGTQRLTRLLGESRAMEFMLLGRTLRPTEMVALGLAQACVGDALAHAQAVAEQITLRPAKACAYIKALVRAAQDGPLSHGEALERTFFCDCMIDDDAQPLMQAVGAHERSIAQAPPRGP